MKIGILTFHCAINYGAVLQTYGLQESLKNLGHDAYIIDYRPEYLKQPYSLFSYKVVKERGLLENIRSLIRELLAVPIRYKRRVEFNRFIRKYLNLTDLDFQDENNDFDCFVFGSDQIWNSQLTGGDSIFFGDSPCFKRKRIIAYAASAGSVSALKEIDIDQIKVWLRDFSALSVREQSLSIFLFEEFQLKNQLVIDPVLLAGQNVFHQLTSIKKSHKPYLLFFSLCGDDKALDLARQHARLQNLDFIEIYSTKVSVKHMNGLQYISPTEFVDYFKNAKFVVTTSYHGTVFSILFHKPFICVGQTFGKSRFHSLLTMLRLQDRLVDAFNPLDCHCSDINWDMVDNLLFEKRKQSLSFLERSLSQK